MKKLIIIALLLSGVAGKAQNEYFQHNPQWTVMEAWSQTYPCVSFDTVTFYINGDTIINSLTYKKLFAQGTCRNIWYSNNPNMGCSLTPFNYPYAGYTGALRSAGTVVYFVHDGFTGEDTLFDFNLQVGSHVPHSDWTTQDTSVTITSIDSVYTPYGYLKKFHLSTDTSKFLMEGAASSYGLYHFCAPMMDFASYLMCYSLNDTMWWPQQGPDCAAILLNDGNRISAQPSLQLIPNPANDYVNVVLRNAHIETVMVYDVFGKAVKQQSGDAKLFVGDLKPGIYFVRVSDGTAVTSSQLVIE
jgi:hypothetical protein